jgi:hypothetical protein
MKGSQQDPRLKLEARAIELMAKGALALVAGAILGLCVWALFANTTVRKDLLSPVAALLICEAVLFLAANLVALHVNFHETKLIRQRGLWPFKRTDIVNYTTITRVRASDTVEVTVDLDDGRRLKLADLFTEVAEGSLPDVELKVGERATPMLRLRKIARFIELAVEEHRAGSG